MLRERPAHMRMDAGDGEAHSRCSVEKPTRPASVPLRSPQQPRQHLKDAAARTSNGARVGTNARAREAECARFETGTAVIARPARPRGQRATQPGIHRKKGSVNDRGRAQGAALRRTGVRPPAQRARARCTPRSKRREGALVVVGRPDHHLLRLRDIADLGRGLAGAL